MSRIHAVLFDAAGTLIRLRESVGATYARFAERHRVSLPASRLDEAFHRVVAKAPPNVHPGVPAVSAAERERAWWRERVRETFRAADGMASVRDFEGYFDELWRHYATAAAWELAPGATQALDALAKAGRRLGVLSNFDQRLRPLLRDLGVHERFEVIVLPGDVGAGKPDRLIFDTALKRLGRAGHHVVYVGDRAREDVEAAKAAELHAIDVGTLASLAELPARVDAIERESA
jgi:putative hydrolase of the HAD superfamily